MVSAVYEGFLSIHTMYKITSGINPPAELVSLSAMIEMDWMLFTLKKAYQGTTCEKRASPLEPELCRCYNTPQNHLGRYPAIGTNFLTNEL